MFLQSAFPVCQSLLEKLKLPHAVRMMCFQSGYSSATSFFFFASLMSSTSLGDAESIFPKGKRLPS